MSMHKRRKRLGSQYILSQIESPFPEDWEAADRALERIDQWDKEHPTGEGVGTYLEYQRGKHVERPCTYQWVRVKNSAGKVLGTFYIRHHEGEILELFLAPARKGVRPNPYDRSSVSRVSWTPEQAKQAERYRVESLRRASMSEEEREQRLSVALSSVEENFQRFLEGAEQRGIEVDLEKELERWEREKERIRQSWSGEVLKETRSKNTANSFYLANTGWSEANKVKGQRPTTGVYPATDLDGDVRFRFSDGKNGFSVRGSILAPLLFGCRQQGIQYVSLDLIRRAGMYKQ